MKWTTDEFTGKRFGKYEVLCRLAVGGMAEIFLGFARTGPFVGRPVVLKRILAEQREDPAALQMLIDEAKLTATLSHGNVAQVLDLEIAEEDVLLVIEFISGANLEEVSDAYQKRGEPVPLGFALGSVREAAQGLAHAHSHRNSKGEAVPIIHRDVTPRNVMVDFDGAIKVLDFGIARAKGSERRTQAGMVRGTTAYMSPEQAIGKEPDPRSDLFSLGIIFHELLTGQRLFYKGNPAQEMAAVYEGEIPPPSKVNRRVPKALDPVVMKLLERKLDRRYQTATEFIRDLSLSAGSTMWPKERSAEMVRGQFSERQRDSEALIDRIPSRAPDFPEGRTQITRGGPLPTLNDDQGEQRTMMAQEPLGSVRPRPSTPPKPMQRREAEFSAPVTDPARVLPLSVARELREPVTDTSRAREERLNAADLFGTLDEPEKTRIVPPSRKPLPPVDNEVPTDPRRGAVVRANKEPVFDEPEAPPEKASGGSTNLVVAAVLALVLGAAGGAFIFKSMQKPGGTAVLVRVTIDADRQADVVMGGQELGKTPVTAVFPEGHHVLLFREDSGGLKVYEVDVKANAPNLFQARLDTLKSQP